MPFAGLELRVRNQMREPTGKSRPDIRVRFPRASDQPLSPLQSIGKLRSDKVTQVYGYLLCPLTGRVLVQHVLK